MAGYPDFSGQKKSIHFLYLVRKTTNLLVQKQPPEVFYKRCSYKFHKIHRETPVPESFFNKVAGQGLQLY